MKEVRDDIEEAKTNSWADQQQYPESQMLQERLDWFQDLKFGVIFHYGLYAQAGIVESWQLSEEDLWAREGRAFRDDFQQLQLDYWQLISQFDPVKLDTDHWAEVCKAAGFKYCIFTTKHHDGFNLFNTLETEFKIGGKLSPFKRDILQEVFTSFRKAGLGIGAYYSKADWYSPFYWLDDGTKKGRRASYDPEERPDIWARYVAFVHRQIHEITTQYGEVDLLWLDGGWCGQGKEDLQMDRLAEIARENQPELIIVDRMMGGRHENYVTPERKIPNEDEIPDKVWESNIPIGNDWGYVPSDTFKSSQVLIETLIDVVSKGGNLILGVGPTPEGTFTEEETAILADIGAWLDQYGEGIYETRSKRKSKQNQWWFTYHKAQQVHYAFCSVRDLNEEKIYLDEINAEKAQVIDLATNRVLSVCSENGRSYISKTMIRIPSVGAIGLKVVNT